MRAERIKEIAEVQAAQWADFNATNAVPVQSSPGSMIGAYWPIGADAPRESGLSDHLEVTLLEADDQGLTLAIRSRDDGGTVLVLIDLAELSDEGEGADLIHTLIFVAVMEFIASPRWNQRHAGSNRIRLTF